MMAAGLLIIIWAFLLHMILNQAHDAHLQLLLDLMDTREEESKGLSTHGPSPCPPLEVASTTLHATPRSAEHQSL
jgi:hypothetical protein